jgi:hypothetical protein
MVVCEFDGSSWLTTAPSGGAAGVWIGANDGTLTEAVAGTFTFTKDTAGTVTITAADDNAVAALTVLAGGAAALTLGGPTGLSVILDTEGLDFNLDGLNAGTGSLIRTTSGTVVLDFRDYGDTTDDDMAHAAIAVNCPNTGTGAEDCDITLFATEAGSLAARILIDGDGNTEFLNADPKVVPETSCAGQNCGAEIDRSVGTDFPYFTEGPMYAGQPRITQNVVGTMGNGTIETIVVDPTVGSCAPIGGGAEIADTAKAKTGTWSYRLTFDSSVGAAEGFDCNASGHAATGSHTIHMWVRSSVAYASGDLEVVLDDGGSAEATSILPAYTVPGVWEYIYVDVSGDCAASCDDLDGFFIQTTAQAPTTFNDAEFWFDKAVIGIDDNTWGLDPETVQDGIISVIPFPDAGGAPETCLEWTCWYFLSYQVPEDASSIGAITDQTANTWVVTYVVAR